MQSALESILLERIEKDKMVAYLKNNPESIGEAIHLSLDNKEPLSWRAAWILEHSISKNDARLTPFIDKIIEVLPSKKDGHQRELLKLLEKLKLGDDQEGVLYDVCISIWQKTGKSPSVRSFAFRFIHKMVLKYPELKSEVKHFTQDEYLKSLSPGIKKSMVKLLDGLKG